MCFFSNQIPGYFDYQYLCKEPVTNYFLDGDSHQGKVASKTITLNFPASFTAVHLAMTCFFVHFRRMKEKQAIVGAWIVLINKANKQLTLNRDPV